MDKDIKMNLIKGLLSGRLTKKQRRGYAELESVDKELKIQWNESGNKTIDLKIKEQIWEKVKARCIDRKKDKVLLRLSPINQYDYNLKLTFMKTPSNKPPPFKNGVFAFIFYLHFSTAQNEYQLERRKI